MDAPPTGRIARFLNVNAEVAGLARIGPVNKQAESIMRLIRSPQTAVHLVALLEEMPVQETLDGIEELRSFDLPVGGIIVNRVHTSLLPSSALKSTAAGKLDIETLREGLASGGIKPDDETVRGLASEATDHAVQVSAQRRLLTKLKAAQRPTYQLPDLDTDDIARLYALASELAAQGAA
jgi:anion-transporting  ArsA/GET3 family ATPase